MTSLSQPGRIVLGSGSPRRLDLLSLLVEPGRIEVVVPDCDELPLDGSHTSDSIDKLLHENVRLKHAAVLSKLDDSDQTATVICADTVVVVKESDTEFRCLGKPPEPNWQPVVKDWFTRYYVAGPHWIRTCFCLNAGGKNHSEVVQTSVEFRHDAADLLPWYFETLEPLEKAGGYAIQGAGSVFATNITGSLSNVIGLPLEHVMVALEAVRSEP